MHITVVGSDMQDTIKALVQEAQSALGAFWTADRVVGLCRTLVGTHFRLTARYNQHLSCGSIVARQGCLPARQDAAHFSY